MAPLAWRYSLGEWHVEGFGKKHAEYRTDNAKYSKYDERQRL